MSGEGEKVVHGPEKDNNTKKTARRTFEFGQVPEANEQLQVAAAGPSTATTSSGLPSPTKSPTKAQLFSGLTRVANFLEEEDQRMLQVHGFSHVEIPCERLEIVLERDRKEQVRRRVRAEREGRASNLELAVAGDEEENNAEKRDKKFKQDEKKNEEEDTAEQQQQKVKNGGRTSNLELAVAGDQEKREDEKKERNDDEEDAAEQQQQKVKKGGKKKKNKRKKITRRDEEQVVVAVTGQEEDEEEFGGEPGPSNLEKTEQQPEKEDEAEEKRKKRKSQQAGTGTEVEVEGMIIARREVEEGEEAEKEDMKQKQQQKVANEKEEGGPLHQPAAEEDNMVNENSSSSKLPKFNKNSSKKRKPKQQQTQHPQRHNGLIVNPSSSQHQQQLSQQQQQLSQSLPLLPLPMPSPNDDGGLGLSAAVEGGGAGGCRGVRRRRKRASDIVMDQQTTQQKQPATTTAAAAALANSTQIAAKPKKTQLDGAEELTMREGETVRRAHVREAITAALQRRSTAANMFFSPKRYRDLGKQIEQELHNAHGSSEGEEKEKDEAKEFGPKYDLWFNDFVAAVNDEQNGFFRGVLRDKVPLKNLVLMSIDQMSAAQPVAMANNNNAKGNHNAAKGNRGGGGNDQMPIQNSNNNAISSQMPMWTSTILADADSTSSSTIFDKVTHTRHTTSTQDDGSLDTLFNDVSTCSLEMVPMQIIDDCNNVHEQPQFDLAANIVPDQVDRSPAHFHGRTLRNANGSSSSSNRGGISKWNSQLDFAEILRAKLRAKLQRKEAAASQLPTQNGSNISAFDAAFDALAEYGDLGTDAIAIGELDAADLREEEEEAAEKEQQQHRQQIGLESVNPNVDEPAVPVTAAGGFAAAEEGSEEHDGIEGGGIEDPEGGGGNGEGGGNEEDEFAGLELEEESDMSNEMSNNDMSNVATAAFDGHQQQQESELNDDANAKQHPQQQMGPRTPPGEPPMTPDQQLEEPCLEQQQQLERAQNGQNSNADIADDGSQSAEHNLEKNHGVGESALSDVQTPISPADVEQEPQQLMGDRFFIPGTPPTQEGENAVGDGEQPAHEELQAAEQEMPSDDIVGETPVPEELQLLEEGELLEEDEEQPEMEDELLELDGEEDEEQLEVEGELLELDGEEDEEQPELEEEQLELDGQEDEEQLEVEEELLELDGEEDEEQFEVEDDQLELYGEEEEQQPEMEDELLELDGEEEEQQPEVEDDQLELHGEEEEQQPEMEDEPLELDGEEDEEQLEVEEELLEYEAENEQDESQRNLSWPRSAVERRTSSASGSRGAMPVTFQFNISNMANRSANCSNGSRGWAADRSAAESSMADENISPHQPTAFGLEMAGGRLQRPRSNWNRTATTMNGAAMMVDGRQNRSPATAAAEGGGGKQNHRLQQRKQQQKFMAEAERGGGKIYHACAKAKAPMDSRANLPAKLPSYILAKCSSSSGGHSSSNNNTFWHGPPAKSWHGPATGPTTISSNRTQEWKREQQQQRNGHRQPQVKLNWWYDDNHMTVNPNNNSVNCKSNSKMPKKQQPMAPPQHPAHQMPMSNLKKRPAAGILPNAIFDFIHYTHSAAGTKTAAGFRSPREGAKKRPANTNGGGGGGGNSEQKSGFFFNYSPAAAGHQSFGPREEEHGGDHRQDQFRQPMATWRNDCVEPPDRKRMRLRDGHQHHGHARAIKKN